MAKDETWDSTTLGVLVEGRASNVNLNHNPDKPLAANIPFLQVTQEDVFKSIRGDTPDAEQLIRHTNWWTKDDPLGGHMTSKTIIQVEITIRESNKTLTVPMETGAICLELSMLLAYKTGTDPNEIYFVTKQGCSYRRMYPSEQVRRKMMVKGIPAFQKVRQTYAYPKAIIGAGHIGLKTAMYFLKKNDKDFIIFDRMSRVGGTSWMYQANTTSKLQTEYGAYHLEFDEENPCPTMFNSPWPSRNRLLQHFHQVSEEYGLLPYCKLTTNVKEVNLIDTTGTEMPRWPEVPRLQLETREGSEGSLPEEEASVERVWENNTASNQLSLCADSFNSLLQRLSAEHERLRQENVSLMHLVHGLRVEHVGNKYVAGEEFAPKPSSESPAVNNVSLFFSAAGARPSDESLVRGSGQHVSSLWRSSCSQHKSWQGTVSNVTTNAAPHTPQSTHRDLEMASCTGGAVEIGLQSLFRELDDKGVGHLSVEDLADYLEDHGEPVDHELLSTTCRLLNAAAGSREDNNIEEILNEPVDPGIECCLRSLQRACQSDLIQRLHSHKTSTRLLNYADSGKEPPVPFWLETLPMCIIVLNMFVIGLSADHEDLQDLWDLCEAAFVTFYFGEFLLKVNHFGWRGYFQGSQRWWNRFDFACLLLSLVDVGFGIVLHLKQDSATNIKLGGLWMIKVFRISRFARLARTLRFKVFYEFKLMVLGVVSGLRVLTWAIVLLISLTYMVGVALTFTFKGDQQEFNSVLSSMFTLFRCWTDGCEAYDGTPLPERLRREYGPIVILAHILMTMFVTVGVFNLVMAIFIDNVVTSQMVRKTREMQNRSHAIEVKVKRLIVHYVRQGVQDNPRKSVLQRMHSSLSGSGSSLQRSSVKSKSDNMDVEFEWECLRHMEVEISRDLFMAWLEDDDFQQLLDEAEIEMTNQLELFDILDTDMNGQLSLDEISTGLMKLRGPVTKADIVSVRLKVRHLAWALQNQEGEMSPRHRPAMSP